MALLETLLMGVVLPEDTAWLQMRATAIDTRYNKLSTKRQRCFSDSTKSSKYPHFVGRTIRRKR